MIQLAMTEAVEQTLRANRIPPKIIDALKIAIQNAHANPWAHSYAHGLERANQEYGLDGIVDNVNYLMLNVSNWRGAEAKACKKTLRDWCLQYQRDKAKAQ